LLLAIAAGPAAAQELSPGARAMKKCLPCHTVGEGAEHRLGPILNGLEGRKAGTSNGYTYSEANKASGIIWTETSFTEYIRNPKAKIPGTKMMFAGIKSETEIAILWAYIKQFGPDGKTPQAFGSMVKP
jgi:cytochrome c